MPEGRQLFAPLSVEDNVKLGAWSRRDADINAELLAVYALFPMLAARRGTFAGMLFPAVSNRCWRSAAR